MGKQRKKSPARPRQAIDGQALAEELYERGLISITAAFSDQPWRAAAFHSRRGRP